MLKILNVFLFRNTARKARLNALIVGALGFAKSATSKPIATGKLAFNKSSITVRFRKESTKYF